MLGGSTYYLFRCVLFTVVHARTTQARAACSLIGKPTPYRLHHTSRIGKNRNVRGKDTGG